MSKTVVGVFALIALAILVGGFVKLGLQHGDASQLLGFVSSAVIPAIPAVAGWLSSRKAHAAASDAHDTAQQAVSLADTAATAATNAEVNTNGKMDVRFGQVRTDIANLLGRVNMVDAKVTQHIADHEAVST